MNPRGTEKRIQAKGIYPGAKIEQVNDLEKGKLFGGS